MTPTKKSGSYKEMQTSSYIYIHVQHCNFSTLWLQIPHNPEKQTKGSYESQKAPTFTIVLSFDCNNRKRDELEGKKIPDLFAETEEKQY